jgi:hypothetical protein
LALAGALFFASFVSLELIASPLKQPKRLVGGQMVDLTPLCKWWTNHAGSRPLSAWVHVSGVIAGTNNSWGWIVEGHADSKTGRDGAEEGSKDPADKGRKILLLHPPLQDLVVFEQLSAQFKSLSTNRAQVVAQEGQLKTRQQAVSKEQEAAHRNHIRAPALSQENKDLSALDTQAKAQLKLLDQQIQALKNKLAVYPSSDHYVLDCFALDTGQKANGFAVYDHGTTFQ